MMGDSAKTGQRWIYIKNKSLISLIVKTYADADKKKILDATQKPRVIIDIVDKCDLPQTSTYRKINSLMHNGLLIPAGNVSMKHGKIVTKYVSLFEKVEINVIKNDISIRAKICKGAYHALLEMMRMKIIHLSKNLKSSSTRISSERMYENMQGEGSESLIPYLIKERVIQL